MKDLYLLLMPKKNAVKMRCLAPIMAKKCEIIVKIAQKMS
jgi:hypothetical protein